MNSQLVDSILDQPKFSDVQCRRLLLVTGRPVTAKTAAHPKIANHRNCRYITLKPNFGRRLLNLFLCRDTLQFCQLGRGL